MAIRLDAFLRGEQKFERFEDLRQQIGRDIVAAQSALS
jgi:FAD synthase